MRLLPVYEEAINETPDIVLFKPFTINDSSGGIIVECNHKNIDTMERLKNGQAVVISQPSTLYMVFGIPEVS